MNFKEYWDLLQKSNPIKDNQKIVMSKEQFYKMQKQAFTKGFFCGYDRIKESEISHKSNSFNHMLDEIFKNLFGDKG